MSLTSMTGFSRIESGLEGTRWCWELKSVNGRSLDVRCRLPAGYDRLEPSLRKAVEALVRRGNVTANLSFTEASSEPQVKVNEGLLDHLVAIARGIGEKAGAAPPLEGILAIRGVIELIEPERPDAEQQAMEAEILATLDQALTQLRESRRAEGARIAQVLEQHLCEIEAGVATARGLAATQPGAIRKKLEQRITGLFDDLPGLSEDRVAQEVALLAAKADITEELDRLVAHVAAARDLMAEDQPVGRRLDFLSQEFNREANTLCSKSSDPELTRTGLDLKASIDRFREQIANVE